MMERMMAKMDAWLEEMKAWRKESTSCQEATKPCLEKAKANPEKTMASLEEMKARMDVFEEEKLDASGKACLGKTQANIETSQEPREAEVKADLKEMDTTDMEANGEKSEAVARQEVTNGKAAVENI
jgi:hypothetical protein